METQSVQEVVLFIACALVWLKPLLVGIWKRQVSLLHPSFMVPTYLMFSVSVALSEHWFHWSGRGASAGIREETQALQGVAHLYTLPLLITLGLGFVFHLGMRFGCGRANFGPIDRIHLLLAGRLKSTGRRTALAFACFTGTVACCVPYLIFGQDKGYFWTFALYSCIPFFPFLLTLYTKRSGGALFFLGLAEMLIFPSKGNFFYYFLPYLLFWQGRLLRGAVRFATVCACAIGVYFGTYYLIDLRGERQADKSFTNYVLVREYGFETFAVLTNTVPLSGASGERVALIGDAVEIVPSALLPFDKPQRSTSSLSNVMVRDVTRHPNTGFYRFFCFDAYYDWGVLGSVVYCFVFAYGLGKGYKYALSRTVALSSPWPLMCYLPWSMYAQFWVNGVLSFAVIFSCTATALIWAVASTTICRQPSIRQRHTWAGEPRWAHGRLAEGARRM